MAVPGLGQASVEVQYLLDEGDYAIVAGGPCSTSCVVASDRPPARAIADRQEITWFFGYWFCPLGEVDGGG